MSFDRERESVRSVRVETLDSGNQKDRVIKNSGKEERGRKRDEPFRKDNHQGQRWIDRFRGPKRPKTNIDLVLV